MLGRKKRSSKKQHQKTKFNDKYKAFCYKILGKKLVNPKTDENLDLKLKMANMKYTPGQFKSVIIITGIIITIAAFLGYYYSFSYIFQETDWKLFVIICTTIASALGFAFLPMMMNMRISSRKTELDKEIPFTLSELSVLASTGLTPIKIVRHMARRDANPTMTNEFRKIVHKIDIEGKDIVTAVSETAKESPSETFRETLWDLSNMIHQGGDLDLYLRQRADNTLHLRRHIQEEFTEKLAGYSEMYISLVLVSVLFIGIAAYLMNAFGSTVGPLNAGGLLQLLGFGIIPLAFIIVSIILSTAYSHSGS